MDSKRIVIPKKFKRNSMNSILNQIMDSDLTPISKDISFDLSQMEIISPGGVGSLHNICMWLNSQNVSATFSYKDKEKTSEKNYRAICYLEDCGFFKKFFGKNTIVYKMPEARKNILEARMVGVDESFNWKNSVLKPFLQYATGRNLEFSGMQVGVEEIFNNISDHSSKNIGCVFAQFYEEQNKIIMTISDFGIGIPVSMKKKFPDLNDKELLEMAIKEGVSTQSTPRNRGAGLPNIIKSLTSSGIGKVYILSNYAKMIIENKKVLFSEETETYYPGTFFEIKIDISNEDLYNGEEEEEFQW